MERYKEYKDSGVQWIGKIPSHWKVLVCKHIITIKSGEALRSEELIGDMDGYPVFGGGECIGYSFKKNTDSQAILIGRVGARCGCVSFPQRESWATDNALVVHTNQNSKFLTFLFIAAELNRLNAANAQPLITGSKIKNLKISLPPLSEQKKIVGFLESKTSKIDEYIAEKEKEVQLLNELKEAEIAKVVTQGLNPNVKMKDSGISWIGMIPEHWEVKRIASLFTGKVNTNSDFAYQHAFKFYYGTLVPKDEVGDAEEYRETYVKYQVLRKDDILINGLNLNYDFVSQRVAIAPSDGIITSAYIVARPRKGTNADYYNFLFKAMDSKKLFHGMGTGIRLTLSFDELKKQIVVCPPVDEQRAIVTYINEKTAKVESLNTDLQAEIEYLKEYKQRLIADCVTGQINVQNE